MGFPAALSHGQVCVSHGIEETTGRTVKSTMPLASFAQMLEVTHGDPPEILGSPGPPKNRWKLAMKAYESHGF